MKLFGKLIRETRIIKEAFIEKNDDGIPFRDALEECFVNLCKELEIQVPVWLKKNTTEFGAFRRTYFFRDQFIEKVKFDKLEIRIEQ